MNPDTCRCMDVPSDAWMDLQMHGCAGWMFGGVHEVDGWEDEQLDRWLVIKLINKLVKEVHDEWIRGRRKRPIGRLILMNEWMRRQVMAGWMNCFCFRVNNMDAVQPV